MNYIGSKNCLKEFIIGNITKEISNLRNKVFCDLFAGTGVIGCHFKPIVKQVIANDLEYYSYILNRHYIGNNKEIPNIQHYIDKLNNLQPRKGFIFNHYCPGGVADRMYFTDVNGQKIDAIRIEIESWYKSEINRELYCALLTSLIEAADKVANTTSVYGAFLKKFQKKALDTLQLEQAKFTCTSGSHFVYNLDSLDLIKLISGDILYVDPPYNARQYGSNYHLLNTIALYDLFVPNGKTGLRPYNKSAFCSKTKATQAFEYLIANAKFKYIFVSYNNEGIIPIDTMATIMQNFGTYKVLTQQYKRFKADSENKRNYKNNHTIEYLHFLTKE